MSKYMVFLISPFLFLSAIPANSQVNSILVKTMTIRCTFLKSSNMMLEAQVYGTKKKVGYANVSVLKNVSGKSQILNQYQLPYVNPNGMSLFMDFLDQANRVALRVSGDDMGGMSSLVVGNKTYELTCGIM
ncbi:MAG: hypothetical protein AABY64_10965 [Bdellovibrionota bacterium]